MSIYACTQESAESSDVGYTYDVIQQAVSTVSTTLGKKFVFIAINSR